MSDPDKPIDSKVLVDAIAEVKEMGKDGLEHPSSKPVLIGGAAGAVVGWILPLGSLGVVLGLLAGAAFMLYKRIRP